MSEFDYDAVRAIRADLDLLKIRHRIELGDPVIRRINMMLTRIEAQPPLTTPTTKGTDRK